MWSALCFMKRSQFVPCFLDKFSVLKCEYLIEAYGFYKMVQTIICIEKWYNITRKKILHFLLHVCQFIFIVYIIFFSWMSVWVMNFNKNDIGNSSKYSSQHRCNYRDPPPIISSPVRNKQELSLSITLVSALHFIWQWRNIS